MAIVDLDVNAGGWRGGKKSFDWVFEGDASKVNPPGGRRKKSKRDERVYVATMLTIYSSLPSDCAGVAKATDWRDYDPRRPPCSCRSLSYHHSYPNPTPVSPHTRPAVNLHIPMEADNFPLPSRHAGNATFRLGGCSCFRPVGSGIA